MNSYKFLIHEIFEIEEIAHFFRHFHCLTYNTRFLDLVNRIFAKMGQNVTGKTLGRIAVEMEEEEDVKLLVEAGTVDWNERAQVLVFE